MWTERKAKEPATCTMLHLSRNISTNSVEESPSPMKDISILLSACHVSYHVFQNFRNSEFLWFHGSQKTWNLLLSLPLSRGLRWFLFSFFSSFHFFLQLKSFWGVISQTSSAADWNHHSPLLYPKNMQSCEQTMAFMWAKAMRLFSHLGTAEG